MLGSDIRIAATTARFNAAFIRIGLSACDIGTSWLLPRLVGAARAQELMLTGRIFDAEEAGRIGLVTDVVSNDALLDAVTPRPTRSCATRRSAWPSRRRACGRRWRSPGCRRPSTWRTASRSWPAPRPIIARRCRRSSRSAPRVHQPVTALAYRRAKRCLRHVSRISSATGLTTDPARRPRADRRPGHRSGTTAGSRVPSRTSRGTAAPGGPRPGPPRPPTPPGRRPARGRRR